MAAAATLSAALLSGGPKPFPAARAAGPAPVSSAQGITVVVISTGKNWKIAASVAEAVNAQLVKRGKVLDSPAVSPIPANDPDYQAFRQAGIKGIRLFKANKAGEAIPHFKQAIKHAETLLLKYGPEVELIKKLVRAYYYIGASHLTEANPSAAAEAFRNAASFDPWGTPSRRRFSMDVVRAYRAAKIQWTKKRGMLIVRANRPARLFVDGHDKGIAPQNLQDLPRGRHLVSLFRLGYLKASKFIDLDGPAATWEVNVSANPNTPEMRPLLRAVDRELRRKKRPGRYLKQLAKKLNASQLVLCRASVDESEASWYDVRQNTFLKRVRRANPVPGKAPADDLAEALMQPKPRFDLKESVVVRCVSDADCSSGICFKGRCQPTKPIYKRWWFWVALGVSVAAAATVGALIGTMPERPIIRITTPR